MREALRPLTDLLEHLAIALRDAETWAPGGRGGPGHPPADDRTRRGAGDGPELRATLDRVDRFSDAGRVTAYLGLVPREDSSAERRHRGAITKAGPGPLRSLLVQASWHIWRCRPGRRPCTRGSTASPPGGAAASRLSPWPAGSPAASMPCGATAATSMARSRTCRWPRNRTRACSREGPEDGVAARNSSWPHVRAAG